MPGNAVAEAGGETGDGDELRGKMDSWGTLKRLDSLALESGKIPGRSGHARKEPSWETILKLAFQTIGVVYGDIGTSPLYVYSSTFPNGIKDTDDILGVLSLIIYTFTLITVCKYVFIVLWANDNGDGGTFALYSLICRYAKVGFIPTEQAEDRDVSNFRLEQPSTRLKRASKLRSKLEGSAFAKYALLLITMLGTSMVIGDGVLTPCISVLSAVGGIQQKAPSLTQENIAWISAAILIILFLAQRFGTDRVGYTFAPVIFTWFLFIGLIGIYNFVKFDPLVIKAVNPKYIIDYFRRNKKDAWISLGGVVLCITGTEAMFADLGHFTVRSIQISMCSIVFPSLMCAYTGQASYLRKHPLDVATTFYKAIPGPLYWPMFVVAVAAAVIASQAMISGTFSIIQQSVSLGCFPRVKIVHTSTKYEGQVYIPEINFLLMLACVGVTLGFKNTVKIGNAYGIVVVFVMLLTSLLLVLIMIMIWKTNIILVVAYITVFVSVELFYLSSALYKFDQGGYLPLAFAAVLMFVMYIWNSVYRKKYLYEFENKVAPEKIHEVAAEPGFRRLPGLGLFCSELVHGIPPIFTQYISNVPALHSVLVFVSIKSLPISKVSAEERFLFRRIGQRELAVFRCVVRYGYTDLRGEHGSFEKMLVEKLIEFIKDEATFSAKANGRSASMQGSNSAGDAEEVAEDKIEGEVDKELQLVHNAYRSGVVYLVGESEVVAAKGSSLGKRMVIDYAYNFLKRNLRQGAGVLSVPHRRLLKVGMTYEI
ncbi:Potassium transporter 5 [Nymphaea thermarum]|nr:Potassium transporter 5 [Nymphaea thermarum]